MRCMTQMLPMLLSDGMSLITPSLVDRNVTVVFQLTLRISLWRCSDLTLTLRPFISVVSYSLSSVFLLLVLFSLDLQNFPRVEFSLLIPFSSSPDMMFCFCLFSSATRTCRLGWRGVM